MSANASPAHTRNGSQGPPGRSLQFVPFSTSAALIGLQYYFTFPQEAHPASRFLFVSLCITLHRLRVLSSELSCEYS
eukprot:scaffold263614_cov31-Prasinocladus_malaysianus.AAC.2